jgi:hypothetical protein
LKKFIKLDDRFSVGSDPYNIILKDKKKKFNRGYSFFPNLDMLIESLETRFENDAVLIGQLRVDDYSDHSTHTVNSIQLLKKEITLTIQKKLEKLKKDLK